MSLPDPINSAILTWVFTVIGAILISALMKQSGAISKDGLGNLIVFFTVTGVCTFIMWLCVWLHQWHPLLTPEVGAE